MKQEIARAIEAIGKAAKVGEVRRAARTAYIENRAPGSSDQALLQAAVIARKYQLSQLMYDAGNHSIGCPALAGGECQCQ